MTPHLAPRTTPTLEKNRRILIVDDNDAIHHDFQKILCPPLADGALDEVEASVFGATQQDRPSIQFTVDSTFQGEEAIAQVMTAARTGIRYAVAFIDVRMPPGWDGMETTLRLWEADPDIQVVICTAYSDYSWEDTVELIGRPDRLLILKKPFDGIEVLQLAHALTEKWSLLQVARANTEKLEAMIASRTEELTLANRKLAEEVAERTRKEEALKFAQFSMDHAGDAMFWLKPDGSFLYVNEAMCRSVNYSRDELLSRNVGDINPELPAANWRRIWERIRVNGHCAFETTHSRNGGKTFPVEISADYFRFEGEEVMVLSAKDITERRRMLFELADARDEAMESARLKSQFLADLSQEIQDPMHGVIGMTGKLLKTNLDREQRGCTETIRASADLLLGSVNDILNYSKTGGGKLSLENGDFDLRETLHGVLDLFAWQAQEKGLELADHIHPEVNIRLHGDPRRLKQVLTTLVGNAVKFTDHGEVMIHVLRVSDSDADTLLRFEVRDTGPGISEEQKRRVFEASNWADSAGVRKFGGTCLGLAVTRQIVERMDGQIGLESILRQGSTFWFTARFETQPQRSAPVVAGGL